MAENEVRIEMTACPQNERFARLAAAGFIVDLNPTLIELEDVKTAVSEAVTNAIIHGYGIYQEKQENKITEVCEHEHCHCEEEGVLKSSLKHTISVFIYIFIISFILNTVIYFIGEDNLSNLILNKPILGPIISGIIGLIPNCASSVILTKLYLSNVISVSCMLAGLLVGAGVGILILCKVNKNAKENADRSIRR